MPPNEYDQFVNRGLFTIRRSDNFWSGTWTDMIIEQSLMRSIKTIGGLTHGRGVTDASLSKWVAAVPYCYLISEQIDEFSGVRNYSSQQHRDSSASRQNRDWSDQDKLLQFFSDYNPFSVRNENGQEASLCCIATGILAEDDVNCHEAESHGMKIMNSIIGENFKDLKLKRSNRVKSLSAYTIKIQGNFLIESFAQRVVQSSCVNVLSLSFTEPASMFLNGCMRKTQKSTLFKAYEKLMAGHTMPIPVHESAIYCIDGGFLLHKVVWSPATTYRDI